VREAIDLFEEAMEADLPEHEVGAVVASLGRAYRRVGDLSYAAELVESYLARRGSDPLDPGVAADLQTVLVSIYFERGDITRAERTARRAMAAADEDTSAEIRARTYWDASRVLAEAKRWDEALELATRARMLLEQLDDRRALARIFNATAFLCLEADPPMTAEAAGHLDRAEALLGEAGTAGDLAYVLTERSRIALLEHRYDESVRHADAALELTGSDELETARCLFLRGRALGELRRGREARGTLKEAATLFEKHGARQQEASCWRELGELDLAEGDLASAVEALRAGLRALDVNRSRA
jgi:tetratricopeptide (TPR) repeat protein